MFRVFAILFLVLVGSGQAAASEIVITKVAVVDSGGGLTGNGNGRIDAGETVALLIDLRNDGSAVVEGATLRLSASSGDVKKALIPLPQMAPGEKRRVDTLFSLATWGDAASLSIFTVVEEGTKVHVSAEWAWRSGAMRVSTVKTAQAAPAAPPPAQKVRVRLTTDDGYFQVTASGPETQSCLVNRDSDCVLVLMPGEYHFRITGTQAMDFKRALASDTNVTLRNVGTASKVFFTFSVTTLGVGAILLFVGLAADEEEMVGAGLGGFGVSLGFGLLALITQDKAPPYKIDTAEHKRLEPQWTVGLMKVKDTHGLGIGYRF